ELSPDQETSGKDFRDQSRTAAAGAPAKEKIAGRRRTTWSTIIPNFGLDFSILLRSSEPEGVQSRACDSIRIGRTADLLRAEFFHCGTGVGARDRRGVRLAGDYRDLAHGLRIAGVEASQWRVEESGMPADAGTVVRSGPAEFTGVAPHQAARAAGGTADGAQRSRNGDERFGRTVRASAVAVAGRRGRGRQRVVPGIPGPLSLPALPRSLRRPP